MQYPVPTACTHAFDTGPQEKSFQLEKRAEGPATGRQLWAVLEGSLSRLGRGHGFTSDSGPVLCVHVSLLAC